MTTKRPLGNATARAGHSWKSHGGPRHRPLKDVPQLRCPVDPALREEWACKLETMLPIRGFVTLTYPHPVSEQERDTAVMEYVNAVERLHRQGIGYVRGDEDSTGRHSHLALIAYAPIAESHMSSPWYNLVGRQHQTSVEARVYENGRGGLAYVMKGEEVEKGEERDDSKVRFSRNIDAFMPHADKLAGTARQRRYLRRLTRPRKLWRYDSRK